MHFFGEIFKGLASFTVAGIAALHGVGDAGATSSAPLVIPEDKGAFSVPFDHATTTHSLSVKSQGEILTSGTVGTTSTSSFALKVKDGSSKKVVTDATTTINVQNGSTTISKTEDLIPGGRVIVIGTPAGTSTINATSVTGGTMELRKSTDTTIKPKDTPTKAPDTKAPTTPTSTDKKGGSKQADQPNDQD